MAIQVTKFSIAYISVTVGPSSIRALICDHSTATTTANPSNLSVGVQTGQSVGRWTKLGQRSEFSGEFFVLFIFFVYFLFFVLEHDRSVKSNGNIVKKA